MLQTRMSTGAVMALDLATTSGMVSRSPVSWVIASAPRGAAARSMRAVVREVIATRAPSAARAVAMARPMPADAPQTRATRPASPVSMAPQNSAAPAH